MHKNPYTEDKYRIRGDHTAQNSILLHIFPESLYKYILHRKQGDTDHQEQQHPGYDICHKQKLFRHHNMIFIHDTLQCTADRSSAQCHDTAVGVLPSLSRLMKDGIGEGFTRKDHSDVSNQLFAAYAKVQDARSLASVIGEDELSDVDKQYMSFGTLFEEYFLNQGFDDNRSIEETLDLGWDLLSVLPRAELDRVDNEVLEEYYDHERAVKRFGLKSGPIIKELASQGN